MSPAGPLPTFKAGFFKALGHPLRIRILELLVAGDRSVGEILEAVGTDQPTVSRQLAVLRANDIVISNKVGTSVRYSLRDPLVGDLLEVARRIFNNQLIDAQSMLHELRREGRRR
jgi:ArsR family transcriptional regulator